MSEEWNSKTTKSYLKQSERAQCPLWHASTLFILDPEKSELEISGVRERRYIMRAIYTIRFEKVADITSEEATAIYDSSEETDSSPELFLSQEYFTDPELAEDRQKLEARVSPETFKVLKELAESGETFVIF